MSEPDYDLCVIGGGVNGAGIARDAAGRGLKVLLVEARDLASATSSASTKLIHGGLRYLEHFEFKLVRESLREREVLLNAAPHIVQPLEFILPNDSTLRSDWKIGVGLFLYDHLSGRRKIKASRRVHLDKNDVYGAPLQERFNKGFSYYDCRADDSRLVVLNAMDAAEKGAEILTYTACTHLQETDGAWRLSLRDMTDGAEREVTAGMVVNAAGPWAREVLEASGLDAPGTPNVRLVKGSHIVVPRRFEGEHAYMLQQPDKRIVFVIPYQDQYTLIGTTDVDFKGDPSQVQISQEEINYLRKAYNDAFETPMPEEIAWTYSGVRPLFDDGTENASAATRDYKIHVHDTAAPLVSVFGGKLTTYRKLSEEVVDRLRGLGAPITGPWTEGHILPGGDIPEGDFEAFVHAQERKYPWLSHSLLKRYTRVYGTRMDKILEGKNSLGDLGRDFGAHIYEAEIFYLARHEFARVAEDVLWRRSKLGLRATPEMAQDIGWLLRSIHAAEPS